MIDDIEIAYRFPPGHEFHLWSVVEGERVLKTRIFDRRRRRHLAISIVRGRGMVLRLCDETREVRLKLSAPSLHYRLTEPYTYNFPLHQQKTVEGINFIQPSHFVIDSLGLKVPDNVQDVSELLRLDRWPVMRVAYAIDADVGVENVYPTFDEVRGSLEGVTRERGDLKAKLEGLRLRHNEEPRAPTADEIRGFMADVDARLRDDPTTAREALRLVLLDGKIKVYPQPDGSWEAESALIFGRLVNRTRKPRNGGPSGASGTATASSSEEVVEIGSCAGAMHGLCTAVFIEFERQLVA